MENGGYMSQEKLSFFALNIIVLLLAFLGVRIVRSTLIRGHNHPSYDLGLILGSGIAGFGVAFVGMNAIYYLNDVLKF
jgi:hypothetical protein